MNVSRQGVHDNLARAEALLRNMEEKTGCVSRDLKCRKAAKAIISAAEEMEKQADPKVRILADRILEAARLLEE